MGRHKTIVCFFGILHGDNPADDLASSAIRIYDNYAKSNQLLTTLERLPAADLILTRCILLRRLEIAILT
jgi:hypothetical protein